ncbi:thrombospondin type 3 repeat-containing protein [Agromyces sp. M3QZ16-3]|uniref:thrombospondin type 3 repeat-containing protein n=1 Tax=Agromyces sp. M3QZ16-3 TaxID=3447585 RepID=UPI003F693B28
MKITTSPTVNDRDGDGIVDEQDNCPDVVNPEQDDLDSDGLGDSCDPDIDGDNVSNEQEVVAGTDPTSPDSDGDGISDYVESNGGLYVDTDQDGVVDGLDTDSDDDGIADADEGVGDSDHDGIPNWRDPTVVYSVTLIPAYAYVGAGGTAVGGETARLSGFGASLVQQVCFVSTWKATELNPRSDAGILWNGTEPAGLDELTATENDYVIDITNTSNKKGAFIQTVVLRYCDTPISTSNGYYTSYQLNLQLAPLGGALSSIEHSVEAYIVTDNGRSDSVSVKGSSSSGPGLKVSWGKTGRPRVFEFEG